MNVQAVALMSNRQRNGIEEGVEQPTLICSEGPSSNSFVIDSSDRLTGNLSEFIVDMGYQLVKSRYIELKRVIVPKLPNITQYNNTIKMRSEFGGGTTTANFTIQPGFYNTTSLSNALVSAINTAFATAGIIDTVTVAFDPITRTFSLQSVNAIALAFDETCSFIVYGKSLVPFESQDISGAATKTTLLSSSAGMLYTRYITVSSDALTQYSIGNGIMSSSKQPPSIIGVIDLIDLYDENDWDITTVYSGIYRAVELTNSPRLFVANSSRSLPRQIDVSVRDMYGNSIHEAMQLGGSYPVDNSSITLLFELYF